jgi:hypothetical protein
MKTLIINSAKGGVGKALRNSEKVLTPEGFKEIQSLKEGSYVIGSNGKPTKILGVYPQGERQLYRVSFKDGTSLDVDGDHLWSVYNGGSPDRHKLVVKTTLELLEGRFSRQKFDKRYNTTITEYFFSIPIPEPMEYGVKIEEGLDPYYLGLLLGDGGFTGGCITFTNGKKEVVDRFIACIPKEDSYSMSYEKGAYNLRIKREIKSKEPSETFKELRKLGLTGCKSITKFIPDIYKNSSLEDRKKLVQGLIDTDGYMNNGNLDEYSTSSEKLAKDFLEVGRSIGLYLTMKNRIPKYTHEGQPKEGSKSYRIYAKRISKKTMVSIEKIDVDEATCIRVEAKDKLFVTRDFNLTHNSTITEGIAKELVKKYKVAIIDLDTTTPNQDEIEGVKTIKPISTNIKTKSGLKKYIRSAYKGLDVDWVLIDTPPTISETYLVLNETIKNAKMLYVTTASPNAIKDTGIGVRFFERRGLKSIGVIQNMLCKEFGFEFDSMEMLGLPTIGKLNLGEFNFDWVKILEDTEFDSTEITTQNPVLSKLTLEDLEKDDKIPLKFYNLETWDYIKDKLLQEEEIIARNSSSGYFNIQTSRFDIDKEDIARVLEEGTHTTIQLTTADSIEKLPMPYEVHEVEIVFNNPVSKGLPMYLLKNGVYLWMSEAMLIDEREIENILESGGFDKGEGRIVPSLYFIIYMKRLFERGWDLEDEYNLTKRYMEEVPEAKIDSKYLESMLAVLEGYTKGEGAPDVESFTKERYNEEIYSQDTNNGFEKIINLGA